MLFVFLIYFFLYRLVTTCRGWIYSRISLQRPWLWQKKLGLCSEVGCFVALSHFNSIMMVVVESRVKFWSPFCREVWLYNWYYCRQFVWPWSIVLGVYADHVWASAHVGVCLLIKYLILFWQKLSRCQAVFLIKYFVLFCS